MQRLHEAVAILVYEDRSFAAQGFGRERRGIAADVERGRVKLHELGVGNERTGTGRRRKPLPARFARIGRDRIQSTDAAGGDDDGAGANFDRDAVGQAACTQSGNAASVGQEIVEPEAFDDADRRRLACGRDQRLHDGRSCAVALHMDDAARGMRGLARKQKMSFKIAVEGHAIAQQIGDARGSFACHEAGDIFVDEVRAGSDRIGKVRLDGVALAHRGGDAALRPGGRRALADGRRREDRHGTGRKLERAEQSGQPAADDNDVVGGGERIVRRTSGCSFPRHPGRGRSPSFPGSSAGNRKRSRITAAPRPGRRQFFNCTMRSTARRARSAMAGSISTSSRR
jgi:hypothetical protein